MIGYGKETLDVLKLIKENRLENFIELYENISQLEISKFYSLGYVFVFPEQIEVENDDGQIDEFTVYPNPNNGIFSIKTSEDYNEAELQVYNNKGVLLSRFQISGEKEIDISDKPSGIYLLRLIEGDEVRSVVVVKL